MAIPSLISLDEAKLHLRIALDNPDYDADVTLKIEEASSILLDWVKQKTIPEEWMNGTEPANVPAFVRSAVKVMLGELHENREASIADVMSPAVQALLQRLWDPALA